MPARRDKSTGRAACSGIVPGRSRAVTGITPLTGAGIEEGGPVGTPSSRTIDAAAQAKRHVHLPLTHALQHWLFWLQSSPGGLWHVPTRVVPTPQQKLILPVQVDVPVQTPSWHLSLVVQPRLSLQLVPFLLVSATQVATPPTLAHT
jgi:hypothetical protein